MNYMDRSTENLNGHWSDRFTKAELIARVKEIGTRRNPTLMKDVAYVLDGGSVEADAGSLADEVDGYSLLIARNTGAYEDAGLLGDVADCLREIEEEYAADMNLPAPPRHDGTCEHGHPSCNPTSDKCGDECD